MFLWGLPVRSWWKPAFDSCEKKIDDFGSDNMSTDSSFIFLFNDAVGYEIELGVYNKFAKM